jgi:hypothetical protein
LPNGIPANTTITDVVIGFASNNSNLFNNKTTGEAPQLSPSYGQYDNGQNVFVSYDNFSSLNSSTIKWEVAGGTPKPNYIISDKLNMSSTATNTWEGLVLASSINAQNETVDAYSYFSSLSSNGEEISISNNQSNFGIRGPFHIGLTDNTIDYAIHNYNGVSSLVNTGIKQLSYGLWSILQNKSNYTLVYFNYNNKTADRSDTLPLTTGYVNIESARSSVYILMQYLDIRNTPPNGVMPSVSFGKAILPAKIQTYVSLTLNNSQSTATSVPFQQMVNMSASVYKGHAASNLQNVEFFYSNGTIIPSWLESYTYSKNALYWLKVGSIPASSTLTVYAGFASNTSNLFNNKTTGEAPTLSSTYAEYDDGANVFLAYFNGNTSISNFNYYTTYIQLSQSTANLNGNNINVINDTRVASGSFNVLVPEFILNVAIPNEPLYIESNTYLSVTSTADNPRVALLSSNSPTSSLDAIGVNVGWAGAYFQEEYINNGQYTTDQAQQGSESVGWVYSSLLYNPGSSNYYGYTAPKLYSTTGGYSGSTTNTLPSTGSLYIGGIGSPHTVYTIQESAMLFNWMRARAYPPNGVMPSVIFGSVS